MTNYAFPLQNELPIDNADEVRQAIAMFTQVQGLDGDERNMAWERISAAAKQYGVELPVKSWRDLPGADQSPFAAPL